MIFYNPQQAPLLFFPFPPPPFEKLRTPGASGATLLDNIANAVKQAKVGQLHAIHAGTFHGFLKWKIVDSQMLRDSWDWNLFTLYVFVPKIYGKL